MKTKLLIAFMALFICHLGHAQIADGSVAPDFTVDDIFGNTHHLQSYLDDDKTVILNISATWCGPCWSYKQTGFFKDFYYSHGPDGSDQVVILYVEGSAEAEDAVDLLYGIGSPTIGNWVEGTPYPIIASQAIASSYQITYFPTVYRICPDGFVYEMGQLNREGIENSINSNCASVNLSNSDNHVSVEIGGVEVCEDGETTSVQAEITNQGNTVTSIEVEVNVNGTVETVNETVNLDKWDSTLVNFDVEANEGDLVFAEVVSVNNTLPHNSDVAQSEDTEVQVSSPTGRDIEVHVYTDNYPGEISWNILDEAGNAVISGGPYEEGNDDNFGAGGPDALTTKIHDVLLPAGEQCFSIELLDSFGDGWSLTTASWDPGIEIFYQGQSVYKELVGNFGSEILFNRAMKHLTTMNTNDFTLETIEVYPNPSNGAFNVSSSENFDVNVFDIQGKKVYSQKNMSSNSKIQINQSSGVYIAEFTAGNKKTTKKLIIK